ncbi:MAG: beta-N-acetylhexosaminidase [Kiritimatiellae bacterium]|nr:beta-N-acetylhexosaminidase [Kiritimatiellia bacterium]
MHDETFPVWPRPQEITFTDERLSLAQPLGLVVRGDADWLPGEADRVVGLLDRAAGRPVVAANPPGAGPALTIGTMDALAAELGVPVVERAEGYALAVSADGVLLAGKDAAGFFYGAQTLAQLLRPGAGPELPGVRVRDWPAFPMRGAHVYMPARAELDFFWRFLDFLADYKYNLLVLEIGGGLEYKRHPEINEAWRRFCKEAREYDFHTDPHTESKTTEMGEPFTGPTALARSRYFPKNSTHTELGGGDWLTQAEARRIAAECRKRHIEIIPEVQGLSHCYYLCIPHPEIAERPDDPWPNNYCPSNPKTYGLYLDVIDEVIEVFEPRTLHIGHDEAYTFGVCPQCRGRDGHELLAEDITRVHDHLAGRGIRTLMWGDKLHNITTAAGRRLGGVERERVDPGTGKRFYQPATYKAADMIPKDVLVADWYWKGDPEGRHNFGRHGLEQIFGNLWPLKFQNWETRASAPNVLGAETSTWVEVSAYAFGHTGILHQFFPGADLLWRGLQMPRAQICALMARHVPPAIDKVTGEQRWLVSGQGDAAPIDLAAAAAPLPESLAGKVDGGARLMTATGTGPFRLLADAQGRLERAVVLGRERPAAGPIAIGGKASRLLLLHGTTMEGVWYVPTYSSYHRGPGVLLEYRVTWVDGEQARFPAIFGEHIGPMQGAWPTPIAGARWSHDLAFCYRAVPVAAGAEHTLFAQEWVNPRPDVPVTELSLELGPDAAEQGAVILAAVSAVP